MKRCHIQINTAKDRLFRPVAPVAFFIRIRVKACGIHILHIWTFSIFLLELSKILLKKTSTILCTCGCTHSRTCSNQNILCILQHPGSQPDLFHIWHLLEHIISGRCPGQKCVKCYFIISILNLFHNLSLCFCLYIHFIISISWLLLSVFSSFILSPVTFV